MNKKTLKALKASIKHWEENVAAETMQDASTLAVHCALCMRFELCDGCPVMAATGAQECENSPYGDAAEALTNWFLTGGNNQINAKRRWRRAAQKEVDFLKSLLPEGEL